MSKKSGNPVEDAWNATRGDDNPEYAKVSPDFRARLQQVYAAARAGQPESGIAGLEKFEEEIRKGVKGDEIEGVASPGTPTLRDATAVEAEAERAAELTPKGSGAQEGSPEKAARDAAAKNASVEHDEEHSPSAPSAARPLGAESPANTADAETKSTKRTKASGTKRAASTKTATKTAAKSTAKKK